ncbi:thiamine diphosphate-binding protein [Dendryphion nanum]|uniref:Pyruvate decarboxylase n=1 Tax=Dendryphion nanum TaxID=256645 RepID=A0A9P9IJA9_9PLEO|nr:thiamine diphosphate-binding protein [Dendryphion nanum]
MTMTMGGDACNVQCWVSLRFCCALGCIGNCTKWEKGIGDMCMDFPHLGTYSPSANLHTASSSMASTINVGKYLLTRLRQLGVKSVHGVPGDYTLRFLDLLKPAGLQWIGNCNELNAAYAADGYARVKGIAALSTTYGVGELSALNAVAGSYAEFSPVVHVVGCAARKAYRSRATVHHSLGDGDLHVYADIYKRFTVAQARLFDPEVASALIDSTLQQCIRKSRPVYFELPSDMVGAEIDSAPLSTPLDVSPLPNASVPETTAIDEVLDRIYSATQPYILVDGLTAPDGVVDEVNELARITGFPTFGLTFGGGIINGMLPNYHGVHAGPYGTLDFMPYTQTADLALLFGPLLSDTNTQGWSAVPRNDITIAFCRDAISIGDSKTHQLHIKGFMTRLLERLDSSKLARNIPHTGSLPSVRNFAKSLPPPASCAPIDQDSFYVRISSFFRPHDIVICANGTPLVGGRDFVFPPKVKLINSSIWLSVGHMLPATQGAALAQQELGTGGRTIFFEGDGSFQATAQELSTIIRYKLNAYIFIINNDGYTFERLIHGMDADYNDVARWNYLKAPEMFGAPTDGSYDVETHDVGNWGELQALLSNDKFQNGQGLKMVNVRMARDDVTSRFKEALRVAGQQLMAGPS